MDSAIWGPQFWRFFDSVAYHGRKAPQATMAFLLTFRSLLPCKYCRESFQEFSSAVYDQVQTPSEFVYQVHEKVNQKLGKANLEFRIYQDRLEALQAPLSSKDVQNILFSLVTNYSHNESPEQEAAFRKMWRLLPEMLQPMLPKCALAIRQCSLPTSRLSGPLLRKTLGCTFQDLQPLELMRRSGK